MKLRSDHAMLKQVCDIAMDGDRGIADTLTNHDFILEKTLAAGDSACRLVFSKK